MGEISNNKNSNSYQKSKCTAESRKQQVKNEARVIDVSIAVFFDGTLNNKYNIEYRIDLQRKLAEQTKKKNSKDFSYFEYSRCKEKLEKLSDSYYNAFTNVFHLWDMFNESDNVMKIYVEGPGSAEPATDSKGRRVSIGDEDASIKGAGMGTGKQGVNGKVKEACKLISSRLYKYQGTTKTKINLTIRAFGFSRGATAARRFVSIINDLSEKEESLSYILQRDLSKLIINKIKVDFMGLFDTVSSYGFLYNLNSDFVNSIIKDNVEELKLSIPRSVLKVVHLVAVNEYREHYALTNIKSADSRGIEIYLPGEHSDVGGGYHQTEKENLYIKSSFPDDKDLESKDSKSFIGWMPFDDLYKNRWINGWSYNTAKKRYLYLYDPEKYSQYKRENEHELKGLIPYRSVDNSFARIPLNIMYNLSSEYIPIAKNEIVTFKTQIKNYKQRTEQNKRMYDNIVYLIKAKALLEGYAYKQKSLYKMEKRGFSFCGNKNERDILAGIRTKYIHLSANGETATGGIKINKPSEDNLRDIHKG